MMTSDGAKKPQWYVYLLRCSDGALYTGISTDIPRRLAEHQQGKGAKYLRGKGPLHLVLKKVIGAKGLALSVESCIKKLSKDRKEALIKQEGAIDQMIAQIQSSSPKRSMVPSEIKDANVISL